MKCLRDRGNVLAQPRKKRTPSSAIAPRNSSWQYDHNLYTNPNQSCLERKVARSTPNTENRIANNW